MTYWKDCIEEAFSDAGITATKEQIDVVINWVEGAHDNYGMANGHEHIPNPLSVEIDAIKKEAREQKESYERILEGVAKGVATRRNVDVSDVDIDDRGKVTYSY